jgi:diguanylate cyclase (GGDEF)-like protein/PAS domain S-box-containing protein
MEKGIRILLVDDDPLQLKLVQKILMKGGYIVETAVDGIDALNYLKVEDNLPDMILSDIFMPKLNGFELCSRVVKSYPNIPVLIITSQQDDEALEKAFHAGASDYIKKPFTNTEILIRVANVIKRNKAEIELRISDEHYKNFYNNALVGLFRTRISDGMYIEMNPKAAEQQGLPLDEIVGKIRAIDQYKKPSQRKELLEKLQKYGEVHDFETILALPNGKDKDIAISVKAYPEKDYMEGAVLDITNRKKAERKLKKLNKKLLKLVFKDSLTNTINKNPFVDLLKKNVAHSKKENQKLALLFMDLENFKHINDIYGHETGDSALIIIADIIRSKLRQKDLIGRIGGDEFVVYLNNIKSIENAVCVAEKINGAFAELIKVNDLLIKVTISIGISIYPDDASDAAELLKNSDIAMYNAKKKKKNSYHVYSRMQRYKLMMEQALFYALQNNEYAVHYQPIVDSKGKCVFLEALLRWNNPVFKDISPITFIPFLEESGEIIKVGKWVYSEACQQITNLKKDEKYSGLKISVNLSQVQIEHNNFVEDFNKIAKETGIDKNNILLEVTENRSFREIDYVIEVLTELKTRNIGIAVLDDYGSGYSSFSNLLRLPVEIVKIDKFLIDNLNVAQLRNATLDIISLIKRLGMEVVAEGIETKEQFDILRETGCDYFQGYYFSRPVPNIQEVLKERNGNFL